MESQLVLDVTSIYGTSVKTQQPKCKHHQPVRLAYCHLHNRQKVILKTSFVESIPCLPRKELSGARRMVVMSFGGERDKEQPKLEQLEISVPPDQRPVNELAALQEGLMYSWAKLDLLNYGVRLGGVWLVFFVFLGGPIAAASFEPAKEPLKFLLAGGEGALFATAILVLRMYLGWSYVGDRLLSAVIAYEETGWYDGQLWVKPPEILARDRLLGSYQVKPILNRLKQTLVGAGGLLAAMTVALVLLLKGGADINSQAIAAPNAIFRLKDVTNLPQEVQFDDDLAEAAAIAADGRPAYCRDRYHRVLAGGQYCKWEDLMQ